jgi:hypothetical protein
MLHEISPAKTRGSRVDLRKNEPALSATCLLCRVLSPIVVQHRHLQFACSSQAKTAIDTKMVTLFPISHGAEDPRFDTPKKSLQ